jgi:hypothetical protein
VSAPVRREALKQLCRKKMEVDEELIEDLLADIDQASQDIEAGESEEEEEDLLSESLGEIDQMSDSEIDDTDYKEKLALLAEPKEPETEPPIEIDLLDSDSDVDMVSIS